MNRIRLWLLGLAILAIVSGGSAGWPDVFDGLGAATAGPVAAAATAGAAPVGFVRGQRW